MVAPFPLLLYVSSILTPISRRMNADYLTCLLHNLFISTNQDSSLAAAKSIFWMVAQGEKLIKRHLELQRTVPITTLCLRLAFLEVATELAPLATERWIENPLSLQPVTVAPSSNDEPMKTPTEAQWLRQLPAPPRPKNFAGVVLTLVPGPKNNDPHSSGMVEVDRVYPRGPLVLDKSLDATMREILSSILDSLRQLLHQKINKMNCI